MKRLLLILAVLCCTTSAANAGPNAGGVLVVHDAGDIDESYVPPPPPADCAGTDNQAPLSTSFPFPDPFRSWVVYAVFPPTSSPRLKSTAWGTQFPTNLASASSYVHVEPAGCHVPDEDGPGTDFWIGAGGFPATSGGEIAQLFPTGPRTTNVVALFFFAGFGYADPDSGAYPSWCTAPTSDVAHRFFVDDAVPPNADPIIGYGCLGFGAPGFTPCPIAPVPTERTSWGQIKNIHR